MPSDSRECKIMMRSGPYLSMLMNLNFPIRWSWNWLGITDSSWHAAFVLCHATSTITSLSKRGPPAAPFLTCKPFQIGPKATSWTSRCQKVSNRSDCRRYLNLWLAGFPLYNCIQRSPSIIKWLSVLVTQNHILWPTRLYEFLFFLRARRWFLDRSRARPEVQL